MQTTANEIWSELEKSQNSQKNTCDEVSFSMKLKAGDLQLYYKKDSGTVVFHSVSKKILKSTYFA